MRLVVRLRRALYFTSRQNTYKQLSKITFEAAKNWSDVNQKVTISFTRLIPLLLKHLEHVFHS